MMELFFIGDIEVVGLKTNLHYGGAWVFLVVIEDLMAKGTAYAVLFGWSAGGLIVILHCGKFDNLFPVSTKSEILGRCQLLYQH